MCSLPDLCSETLFSPLASILTSYDGWTAHSISLDLFLHFQRKGLRIPTEVLQNSHASENTFWLLLVKKQKT